MSRAEAVRRGNIISTCWNGEHTVGCYLGNGRFGAILSGLGLNLHPEFQKDRSFGPSHFKHMDHWGRFRFFSNHVQQESSADYLLPLFQLHWERNFDRIGAYRQCHDLYDGLLDTEFQIDSLHRVHTTAWFDGIKRNIFGATVEVGEKNGFSERICLSALTPISPYWVCGGSYAQHTVVERVGEEWRIAITCEGTENDNTVSLYIATNMEAEITEHGLIFQPSLGRNYLMLSVDAPIGGDTPEASLERTKAWWHKTWQEIGWIEYPDDRMQKVLVRGLAYLLSSYDADCPMIQPSNSMGIGGFPYNFVPDMQYIAPALMMMGRLDIVKHWVELFAAEIEEMRRYTKRLWPDAEGIFPPWELNFGPLDGHHTPALPLIFCYEAHNSGYLCRLAMEAAEFANDPAWAEAYAYPLIRGCAEFFGSACHKEEDGLWHLRWSPCMGRDEAGGVNKEDYLCTLFAARYSFQSAIRCGLDEGGVYRKILTDGLAFESLLSERGTWHTCRGADDFGKQKHPVQLEGIACFPGEEAPHLAELEAYALRYEITNGAKRPYFWGWTLAQLLTADTNLKKYTEWAHDWSLLRPSDNVDENWIQFYETSAHPNSPFYLSTHGMVMQSLIRNCVNDYWGRLDIGSCLAPDACVSVENIHTRLGVSVTGQIGNGKFTGSVTALRDVRLPLGEAQLVLKKGETRTIAITLQYEKPNA